MLFPSYDTVNQHLFVRENYAHGPRIFLAADQYVPYSCNKEMDVDKAWSQKFVAANQFILVKLLNIVVPNNSLLTVCVIFAGDRDIWDTIHMSTIRFLLLLSSLQILR